MRTCVAGPEDNRVVEVINIPGVYLNGDKDKVVHPLLEGQMTELLMKIKPELYRKHEQMNNRKKVICVILSKSLYGCLKSGLLFLRHCGQFYLTSGSEQSHTIPAYPMYHTLVCWRPNQKANFLEYLGITTDFSEEKTIYIKIDGFLERLPV